MKLLRKLKRFRNTLDSLLSKLPMNGDKTVIGIALNMLLPFAIAQFPMLAAYEPMIASATAILAGLGLTHKVVKATE